MYIYSQVFAVRKIFAFFIPIKRNAQAMFSLPFSKLFAILYKRLEQNFLFFACMERLKSIYSIFRSVILKFRIDNCSIRGSAIAYAIVFSIIPLLTIFVQVAKVNRMVVQANIASFLAAYGLADSTELLAILDEVMARAETIAGVGLLFILYSATSFFQRLEDTFNHIYCVTNKRPLLYRFSLYITGFVLLPVIFISTKQAIEATHYHFQAPRLNQVMERSGKHWVISSDGVVWQYGKQPEAHKIDLKKQVSFQAPYRDILIDIKNKRSGYSWEILETSASSFQSTEYDRYDLVGAVQGTKMIYLISSGGTLYYSSDEGQTWNYQQLVLRSHTHLYSPRIKDIYLVPDRNHVILLINEVSHSSIIIRESEKVWRYQSLDSTYNHITTIDNISSTSSSVSFANGLYLLGKGKYIYSSDQGRNWSKASVVNYGDRKVNITAMQADAKGNVYFGGANGAFWIYSGNNTLYPNLRADPYQHVKNFVIYADGSGILYGNEGLFRYTIDSGRNWHLSNAEIFSKLNLLSHYRNEKGEFYLTAEDNTLILARQPRLTTQLDQNGLALAVCDYNLLSRTSLGKSLLVQSSLSLLLLLILFLLLFLLYVSIPYTRVKYKAAAIGAAFSSISMVLFFLFFRIWIGSFNTTGYIYGAWAAIPLGMLIILISIYILLFGLELAFVIQEKEKKLNIS